MKNKEKITLKATSMIEVLVSFSILGISLAIVAFLLNQSLFSTYQHQRKYQNAINLANTALNDTTKERSKWEEGGIICYKKREKVIESGRIVQVVVKCYQQESFILEKKAYQEK